MALRIFAYSAVVDTGVRQEALVKSAFKLTLKVLRSGLFAANSGFPFQTWQTRSLWSSLWGTFVLEQVLSLI